jgi:putative ABC transport system permease protein
MSESARRKVRWHERAARVLARWPVLGAMYEAVGMGFAAIRAYKLRASLTILGVVMGVMTVTGMSSIVAGLNASMAAQIEGLGASVIFIRIGRPGENVSREERRRRKMLSMAEVRAISERCPDVLAIAPMEIRAPNSVKYRSEEAQDAVVIGTTTAYEIVHEAYAVQGRFFSEADVRRSAPVAVLGTEVVEALFPMVSPVDKEISIDNRRFRVVGVMERKGKFLFLSRDNMILVPLGAFGRRPANQNYLMADLRPVSAQHIDDASRQAREALRRKRRLRFKDKDDFGIFTQDTLTDLYRKVTQGIYLVMIAISAIGLVVGGVGVMNIMLVSVTERTREIGVRKALGAKRRDIRWQFLTEAMTLTGVGGLAGVAVGAAVAWIVNRLSPFPAALQPFWIVLALVTSMGVGLLFGLWPAVKAARLDPIESLRYE